MLNAVSEKKYNLAHFFLDFVRRLKIHFDFDKKHNTCVILKISIDLLFKFIVF